MSATVAALEVVLQHEHDPAMEELRRELAAAHRGNSDLQDRNADLEQHLDVARDFRVAQHNLLAEREILFERRLAQARADSLSDYWLMGNNVEPRRLLTWREYLEQKVAYHQEREADLADGANRLMRWASQGGSEEDVPDEVFRAIQVMRGNEYESDDDEMAVDSAAAS